MNRLILALKAFFKAWKDTKGAENFVEGKHELPVPSDSPHLRLLTLLQNEGRLIDFLKEDITQFNDAQIGSAVRRIHAACGKCLEEFVTLRPVFNENEGANVHIHAGYDSCAIKVTGHVKGSPPYQGILRHKGWKAHKLTLPVQVSKEDRAIVYPAEVEVI